MSNTNILSRTTQLSVDIIHLYPESDQSIIQAGSENRADETPNDQPEKGSESMSEERIRQIAKDIENYEKAIKNAEGALAEAERELDELLSATYEDEH